jgi:hypothetical protein
MATVTAPRPVASPSARVEAREKPKSAVVPVQVPAAASCPVARESDANRGDMIAMLLLLFCMAGLVVFNLIDLAFAFFR